MVSIPGLELSLPSLTIFLHGLLFFDCSSATQALSIAFNFKNFIPGLFITCVHFHKARNLRMKDTQKRMLWQN